MAVSERKEVYGGFASVNLRKPNLMQDDPKKGDYVKGKEEFLEQVNQGGNVDLTGYATEQYVKDYAQPKGDYLASTELPTAINTALAQANASGDFDGADGKDGKDGTSATHSWNGTTLTITSASGTSSANLKGDKGDKGDSVKGDTGSPGADGVSPTVAVSKSGKVTTISITDKNGTKTATINDGADGKDADDPNAVPSYWQTALNEGVEAINTAIETVGRNKSAFLFYTDAHWGYGSGMSPTLLKYLGKHTAMNKTIFGGDFGNTYDGTSETRTMEYWMNVMRSWKLAIRDIPNHHSVVGNHDKEVTAFSTDKALYGFLMAPEETNDIVRGGDFFYYIDDQNEKTRYLYLNTGLIDFNDEQCAFVIDALKNLPSGWHIVAVSHGWFAYTSTSTPTVGSVPVKTQKLLDLFDDYNSRKAGSITVQSEEYAYDFTNSDGWVEFCIGGHIHVDHDFTTATGIPVILCATDSKHTRGDDKFTAGTTSEASVSGIIADYDNRKIHVVRVGRGTGREITVTKNIITYTNILPTALAADGVSIYNADDTPGYKANTKWSQSGQSEGTQNGTYLTGWIPVKKGDVIYLRNVNMLSSASNTTVLWSKVIGSTSGSSSGTNLVNSNKGVLDADGNVIQFEVVGDYTFMRFTCAGLTADSIVTKNEPID